MLVLTVMFVEMFVVHRVLVISVTSLHILTVAK